jgi:hypothetical protein
MRRSTTQSVCLNGLALAAMLGGADVSGQAKAKQVVLVYNQARVAPDVMSEAQNQALRIFRKAVVVVNWIDCKVVVGDGEVHDTCRRYYDSNPIFLQILPTAGAFPNRQSLAHAAVALEGGVRATVFFDRVQEFVKKNHSSFGLAGLMGHVMAHEVGHLLLSRTAHSAKGLMAGPWGPKHLAQAANGTLLFTPEEGARMREEVTRRAGR